MNFRFSKFALYVKLYRRRFGFTYFAWRQRRFNPPSPKYVKDQILTNNCIPGAVWIETGTYLGETTLYLAKHGFKVTSLEPSKYLFDFNRIRLRKHENIKLVNGTSEEFFETEVVGINAPVNFWLDGHGSGDVTFVNENITPIKFELDVIEKHLKDLGLVCIFVDDFRGFPKARIGDDYPSRNFLVDWALRNNLNWDVQHDIFIASNYMTLEN